MKKSSKVTRLVSLLIALITLFAFTGCATLTNPAYYLDDSIEKTADSLFDFDIAKILSKAFENGSVSVGVSGDNEILPFENLNATFFFDQSESSVASEMSVKVDGEVIDATAYISPESYVLKSNSILGGKAYGVDLETVEENYPKSIFADEDSEFYIEMDADEYTAFLAFCGKYSEFVKTTDELSDIYEKYEILLKKSIKKHAETDRFREDGITYVSMTFDNESIANIFEDLVNEFKKDEEFKKIITDYMKMFDMSGESFEDDFNNFINNDLDDLIDNIKDAEDIEISVKVGTKNKLIKNANIEVEYDNIKLVTFTADIEDDKETYSIETTGVEYKLIYDKIEDSRNLYSSKITLIEKSYGSSTTLFTAKIEWDKKNDDLEIDINVQDEMDIKIKGSLEVTKNSFSLTVNKMTFGDDVIDDLVITVSANASATMPKAPSYTDVLLMKEDEFSDLFDKILSKLDEIVG